MSKTLFEEKAVASHGEYADDLDKEGAIPEQHALEDTRPSFYLMLIVLCSSVSHFMFGYDTGYISTALINIKGDLTGKTLTYGQKEFITSATSLGALVGSIFTGFLADKFGRKPVTIGANIFLIAGAGVQVGAHHLWDMIGGRFLMGIGVGLGSVIAPLYITEISPPKYRGRLVLISSIIRTGAQVAAAGIGTGLQSVHNGWRILIGIALIPPVLQMVLMLPLPDSPRYLVQSGQLEKARAALRRTHSGLSDQGIELEINELVAFTQIINPDHDSPLKRFIHKFKELHTVGSNLRGLIIICGMQGINQFTGYNSLNYFAGTLFQMVGFKDANAVSIVISGTNFVFTIVAYFLIDRCGRRILMLVSLAGMVVGLVIAAIAFHFLHITFVDNNAVVEGGGGFSSWGIVIMVMLMVYVAFFAIGCGAVPWQQSELLPMYVRGLGSSLAVATNWSGSLTIASTFLLMMERITPTGTFAFYAAISALSFVLIYLFFPELSGLGLEETQMLLTGGFKVKQSLELSKARRAANRVSDRYSK